MRKTLLVVIAGLLAVGAGLYVVVVRPVMAPSEEAPIAERALVKPDVVLLAEVNVKEAVFLEKWFLGSPVFDSADGRPLPAAQERTLLGHLRAANVDPRRDIDQLFYALYPADDAGLRQAIVLLGRFDPAAVGDYLARELHGIRRAVSGRDVYEITTRDLTTCAPSSTWMVTVDPTWILVAPPRPRRCPRSRRLGPEPAGLCHDAAHPEGVGRRRRGGDQRLSACLPRARREARPAARAAQVRDRRPGRNPRESAARGLQARPR